MKVELRYVRCDGCGDTTVDYAIASWTEALMIARGLGYTLADGRDLCGDCSALSWPARRFVSKLP